MSQKSFNGDHFLKESLAGLVEKYGVKTIIETGTYMADSTFEFEKMVDTVYTIEVNETYFYSAKRRAEANKSSVNFLLGSSPEAIKGICSSNLLKKPILFFLDAHWYGYNPLLDELKTIAECGLKDSIIVIHDFKVPGKDFGFDLFPDKREYSWENICENVENIYGNDGFVHYYNTHAAGSCRGVIFICPK